MKVLPLFLLLFSFCFSSEIVNINGDDINIKGFQVGYLSNTKDLTLEELKTTKFNIGANKKSLGADAKNSLVRIKLHNQTDKQKKVFIHQNTAYLMTYIKCMEVDSNGELLKKVVIDPFDHTIKDKLYGSNFVYELSLSPSESKTIYIFQKNLAHLFYNFSILDEKSSKDYLVLDKVDGIFFLGVLLTLAFYNFIIYISSKYKEYLYYSLYLFSSSLWVFYIYGSLSHYFKIYGFISYQFNFALMLTPIFLALFVQSIFNTKKSYKKEHYLLNSLIILLSINVLYGIIDYSGGLGVLSISLAYAMVVFLFISISIYMKGNKIVKIFFIAHIFYLVFNIYAILFYIGVVEFTYISSHGIGIGIGLEAMLLSYLVSYKFKIMESEREKTQLMLFQKVKMADMGEMIANIAHQWRQPLSIINISLGILKEKKNLNLLTKKDLEDEIACIDLNISHMSQTIEDFLTYFKPNKTKEEFYLIEVVNKALLIIGNSIYKEEIIVKIDIDDKDKAFGNKEEFVQVLISIISNAVYALKEKKERFIYIKSYTKRRSSILEISDNAGGIPRDIIEKIFEPYFSTKDSSKATGLGLYIAKNIIENSMNGALKVSNTKDGVKFTIEVSNSMPKVDKKNRYDG